MSIVYLQSPTGGLQVECRFLSTSMFYLCDLEATSMVFFTMIVEQCDIQACYSALLAEKARICFFIVKHADVSESHLYHLISTIK